MEDKNVQNSAALTDKQLEQTSGGIERSEIQRTEVKCPRCGKELNTAVQSVFTCPYCSYQAPFLA